MSRGRDYDDDDLDVSRRPRELSGLDHMYATTSMPILILFGLCCGLIAIVLSAVAMGTCKDPTAKKNATTTLIVAIIAQVVGGIFYFINLANQPGGFRP